MNYSKIILIALFLVITSHFTILADTLETAKRSQSKQAEFFGLPLSVIVGGLIGLLVFALSYILYQRKDLKIKKRQLQLQEEERAEKHEVETEAKRAKEQQFATFEARYMDFMREEHQWLKIQGLKTKTPVSIDLRRVEGYVPLSVYDPLQKAASFSRNYPDELTASEIKNPGEPEAHHLETIRETRPSRIEIARTLKQKKRIVILGGPGSGKTTLIRYLASAFAQNLQSSLLGINERKIPICVTCGKLDSEHLPNSTDLHKWCLPEMLQPFNPGNFFEKNLADGNCLILLDGLDEVPTDTNRKRIVEWVQTLSHVYPRNQFIVTSRIVGYEKAPVEDGFFTYTISDFESKDIEEYIRKSYCAIRNVVGHASNIRHDADNEVALLNAVLEDSKIRRLAQNPSLLCRIVTLDCSWGLPLPANRAAIYKACIEMLAGDRKETVQYPLNRQIELLKLVAFRMTCEGKRDIYDVDLRRILKESIPGDDANINIDEFIDHIRTHPGLLIEKKPNHFCFSRLAFQEYLTALHLNEDHQTPIDSLISKKDNPFWHEILFIFCGLSKNASVIIERLLQSREDVLFSNRRLAGLCAASFPQITCESRNQISDDLFDCYWNIPIDEIRKEVANILGGLQNQETITKFREKLKDEKTREYAAFALGFFTGEEAIKSLIPLIKYSRVFGYMEKAIHLRAAKALGQLRAKEAIEPLLDLLRMDDDIDVQGVAANAINQIDNGKAIDKLIVELKDKNSPSRGEIAQAIGRIGKVTNIDPLLSLLPENDNHLRSKIAKAIRRIGKVFKIDPFLSFLEAKDKQCVRGFIAEALGQIGDGKALDSLIRLSTDKSRFVRACATKALGQIGSEKAITPLLSLLNDKDNSVRLSAAEALGQIGSEKAIAPLLSVLNDKDNIVRGCVARALGQFEKTLEPLLRRLQDKREKSYVRGSAAEALGQIGSEKAIAPLLSVLNDKDNIVRGRVARALGQFGNAEALDSLIILSRDEDSNVRESVAWALGQIGGEKAVDVLITLAEDKDSNVLESVARALGQIGGEKAVDVLITLAEDKDSNALESVARALGQIRSERGLDALLSLLNYKSESYIAFLKEDKDKEIRFRAAQALGLIGSDKLVSLLINKIDIADKNGNYLNFTALYGTLKEYKVYIDQLPPEVIERNPFWKENLKTNPPC